MAQQNEVTRTPDRVKGLENISNAVAKALNYTLGQEIEADKQRKALEAVAQEQAFKQRLEQQDQEAALARLQADLAYKNVADERAKKWKEKQLAEDMRHNKAMEAKEADKVAAMREATRLRNREADQKGKIDWLTNAIDARINRLDTLKGYYSQNVPEVNPAVNEEVKTILRELPLLQRQLEKYEATGIAPSPDILEQLDEAGRPKQFPVRPGLGEYQPTGPGLFVLPESYGKLAETAKGKPKEQPKSKPRLYEY